MTPEEAWDLRLAETAALALEQLPEEDRAARVAAVERGDAPAGVTAHPLPGMAIVLMWGGRPLAVVPFPDNGRTGLGPAITELLDAIREREPERRRDYALYLRELSMLTLDDADDSSANVQSKRWSAAVLARFASVVDASADEDDGVSGAEPS